MRWGETLCVGLHAGCPTHGSLMDACMFLRASLESVSTSSALSCAIWEK